MKRFLKIGAAVAAICLALCFVACKDVDDDESDEIQSLGDAISTAKDGAEIDFGKMNYSVKENDSYTITKKLTITGGDVKNAKFVVKANGVTFSNLKNIDTIIVDELVGDGDFKMENCGKAKTVYVNGGGENSVAIAGTEITNLSVNKSKVHIILGNAAKVTTVYILKDCNLDSKDKTNTIGGCIVSENVSELTLTGTATIDKLVSAATSSSKIKVTIVKTNTSADAFKIMAADNIIKTAVGNAVTISGEVAENDKTALKAELGKYREEYPTVNDGNSDNSGNDNNNGNGDNSGSEDNSGDGNNNGNSDNDSNVDNNDNSNNNDNSDNGADVPNPPKLPVSVGTNEVAGRTLTQTDGAKTIIFTIENDKITCGHTDNENPEKKEETYSYTYNSNKKLIYAIMETCNGMNFSQYYDFVKEEEIGFWKEEFQANWEEANKEEYNNNYDDFEKECLQAEGYSSWEDLEKDQFGWIKETFETIYVYKYTLGGDGIIATIEETCDLSVQDWKTVYLYYSSTYNQADEFSIFITPQGYSLEKTGTKFYIYYVPSEVIGTDKGTITYNFSASEDHSNPKLTDEQKASYVNAQPKTKTFSYEVNKETVTYTDKNGSYILKLKTNSYTDDSVKAQ